MRLGLQGEVDYPNTYPTWRNIHNTFALNKSLERARNNYGAMQFVTIVSGLYKVLPDFQRGNEGTFEEKDNFTTVSTLH
jgi:hypothetical protein